jgi:hypothetical protein
MKKYLINIIICSCFLSFGVKSFAQCPSPGTTICFFNSNPSNSCEYQVCPHFPLFTGSCPTCLYFWSDPFGCCINLLPGHTYCFDDPSTNPCFTCDGINPHDVYWDISNVSDWTDCSCMPCDANGMVVPSDVIRIYLDSQPGIYGSARSHIHISVPAGGVLNGPTISN